jgi:hypothetical protein
MVRSAEDVVCSTGGHEHVINKGDLLTEHLCRNVPMVHIPSEVHCAVVLQPTRSSIGLGEPAS